MLGEYPRYIPTYTTYIWIPKILCIGQYGVSYFPLITIRYEHIPPKMAYLKMIFLFPRWDMLIPWRVFCPIYQIRIPSSIRNFWDFGTEVKSSRSGSLSSKSSDVQSWLRPEKFPPHFGCGAFLGAREMWDPEKFHKKSSRDGIGTVGFEGFFLPFGVLVVY